jgi:hypothetical protein
MFGGNYFGEMYFSQGYSGSSFAPVIIVVPDHLIFDIIPEIIIGEING